MNDEASDTIVTVKSVGPKLDSGEIEKIFQRGFRGQNAVRIRSSGTGLGLSVAASVIDIFGGSIHVSQDTSIDHREGIPHSKTIFNFRLPTFGEDSFRKNKFRRGRERRVRISGSA